MQFDNPMPTYEPDIESESDDVTLIESSANDSDIGLQAQFRSRLREYLNPISFLHGLFYASLLFVFTMLFLQITFDILDEERIRLLILFVVVIGGASTIAPSKADDKVYDPNYIPSSNWRYIVFIFFIIGELLLFLLIRDLISILSIEGLAVIAGLVGAVNFGVLWQFTEEEFDDYVEPLPDRRTIVSNYGMVVLISILLLTVQVNLPILQPIMSVLSLFFFLIYGGLFWSYALFDRETINTLSRITLSFIISILLLPVSAVFLERIGIEITTTVIIVTNFVICTLGFLTYNMRPRLKHWLYAG